MLKILIASLVFFLFSPTAFAQQGGTSSCKSTYEGGVSCGGLAKKCIVSSTGNVACGGDVKSRQMYPPSMKSIPFRI